MILETIDEAHPQAFRRMLRLILEENLVRFSSVVRAVDVWLGLPFILIALVIVVVMGQSMMTLFGVLALVTWSQFVRNVRGEVLSLKTRDYVLMARVMGASCREF